MNDRELERLLSQGLCELADAGAPKAPTADRLLRTLESRSRWNRNVALWLGVSAAAAAAVIAAWVTIGRSPEPVESVEPSPIVKSTVAPPIPTVAVAPKSDAVEPLAVDTELSEVGRVLQALPMLAAGDRVTVRKRADSPMVLVIRSHRDAGDAASEAEADRTLNVLEVLFSGFEEVRISMENGKLTGALLSRPKVGVTVRDVTVRSPLKTAGRVRT